MRLLLNDILNNSATVVTGAPGGNLLTYSDDLANSSWVKVNGTISSNSVVDPAGASIADVIVEATGAATLPYVVNLGATIGVGCFTAAVYIKEINSSNKRYLALRLRGDTTLDTVWWGVVVDAATGNIIYSSSAAVVPIKFVDNVGNGWWRVVIVGVNNVLQNIRYYLSIRDDINKLSFINGSFTGVGMGAIAVCGMHLGLGCIYTSRIATTSAAVSGSSWLTGLPPSNVRRGEIAAVARTAGLVGTASLLIDFPALTAVDCIVMGRTNLSASAQWAVEVFDGAGQTGNFVAWASPRAAWIVAPVGSNNVSVVYLAAPVQARSLRISISDPSNLSGYMQIGRVLVGQYLEPTNGIDLGVVLGWQDLGASIRRRSGGLISNVRPRVKILTGDLALLSASERARLHKLLYFVGSSVDVFISIWPNDGTELEADYQMIGKITKIPQLKADNSVSYSAPFEISES